VHHPFGLIVGVLDYGMGGLLQKQNSFADGSQPANALMHQFIHPTIPYSAASGGSVHQRFVFALVLADAREPERPGLVLRKNIFPAIGRYAIMEYVFVLLIR